MNRDSEERLDSPDGRRRRGGRLIVGRLADHGHANYQFRQNESASYYVKILTNRGERILWGKDLERAITTSTTQAKTGDVVGARRVAREAVTLTERKRDAEGRVVSHTEHRAHRNRWVVEKVQFFAERSKLARQVRDEHTDAQKAVRAHPELASTFLSLRAAEKIAAHRISDPKDRERFLGLVREAMASSINSGAPLPAIRLRNESRTHEPEPPQSPTTAKREGPVR